MTGTGRSNNDVIAEAVAAIGPYKAWMANKRTEIQGQIAQMQAAAATATPTSDGSLASRFRQLGLPHRNGGAGSVSPDAVLEGSAGVDATADTESTHAPIPEGAEETGSTANPAISEEPVSVPSVPATGQTTGTPAAFPTPQNAKEAQAQLEKVFAATPPQTLPPVVVEAWGQRGRNAVQCTKVLVAAQDAGLLPEALAHAVTTMIALDGTFSAVANAYRIHMYPDLVGIFSPTVQGPDGQDAAEEDEQDGNEEEQDDIDAGEREGDEQEEETEKQWGFPGEDRHESPF